MTLRIEPIDEARKGAFAAIWISWLRDTVGRSPEPEDLAVMADPGRFYRATGGEVFLAMLGDEVVGAVAVKGLGASGYEFCKLVVAEAARSHGAGRALVETCLRYARKCGGPALYLQSFKALTIALDLYRRMGFVDVPPPPEMTVLGRTEIIMAKDVRTTEP